MENFGRKDMYFFKHTINFYSFAWSTTKLSLCLFKFAGYPDARIEEKKVHTYDTVHVSSTRKNGNLASLGCRHVLKAFVPECVSPLVRDTSCRQLSPRPRRQVALFGDSHVTRWITQRVCLLSFVGDYLQHAERWHQPDHGERTRDFQPFAHSESDRGRRGTVHLLAEQHTFQQRAHSHRQR